MSAASSNATPLSSSHWHIVQASGLHMPKIAATGLRPETSTKLKDAQEKISTFASSLFDLKPDEVTAAETILATKLLLQITPEEFQKLSNKTEASLTSHEQHLLTALNSYKIFLQAIRAEIADLSSQATQDGTPFDATHLEVMDEACDNMGDLLWGYGTIAGLDRSVKAQAASKGTALFSAVIGLAKSVKNGWVYWKANKQLRELQSELKGITVNPNTTPEQEQRAISLTADIALLKDKAKEFRNENAGETAINVSFFTGTMIAMTSTSTFAGYSSIVASQLFMGGVLIYKGTKDFAENVGTLKTLNEIERSLQKKNPQETIAKAILQVKKNFVASKKKEELQDAIINGLTALSGVFCLWGGTLALLAKTGIAISGVAIAATGIGLAVVVGLGLVIGAAILINHYINKQRAEKNRLLVDDTDVQAKSNLKSIYDQLKKLLANPTKETVNEIQYLRIQLKGQQGQLDFNKKAVNINRKIFEIQATGKKKNQDLLKTIEQFFDNTTPSDNEEEGGMKSMDEMEIEAICALIGLTDADLAIFENKSDKLHYIHMMALEWIQQVEA